MCHFPPYFPLLSIVDNKKAFHDYFIEERFEAGMVLEGWEVKSIRAGRVQLKEAYVIVRKGEVWTSTGDYCLAGITRANVIRLCRENDIPVFERNFSMTDVYGADEAFVTGTFAGVVPAHTIDGRVLTDGKGPVVERLQNLYRAFIERDVAGQSRP